MEYVKKCNEILKKIELAVGTAGLFVIFFLITVNIIRRYFFHNAWGWSGELNGFCGHTRKFSHIPRQP